MSAYLVTHQVCKSYGAVKALNGVDIAVQPGEFVALLGPNGAGKSTLFQLLSGLFVADSGQVLVHGSDMAKSPIDALAKLGIVFQTPTLDLDLSVEHNLRFHCQLHGLNRLKTQEAIERELSRLDIESIRQSKCRTLSGGNRRKVELARALLHNPSTLLMDEATVGLDPASRQSLLAHVRELCREQKLAVLWTTHLVEEVEEADRILVLNAGRIQAEGDSQSICQQSGQATLLDAFIHLTKANKPTEASPHAH